MGSRYGGLKQIEPIGPHGETIIDYSIYDAMRAGFGKVFFVIRREIETVFKEYVGRRFEPLISIEYLFQELNQLPEGFSKPESRKKPWGTGHAVLAAKGEISEPFAVINADDFYGQNSFQVLADYLRASTGDYAMIGFILKNTLSEFGAVARGVCATGPDDSLQQVTELTNIVRDNRGAMHTGPDGHIHRMTGSEVVSLNMWGFMPTVFSQLEREFKLFLSSNLHNEKAEFYIPTAINSLIRADEVHLKVLRTPDSWFGVTFREDRPRVIESIRALVRAGRYPEKLWA